MRTYNAPPEKATCTCLMLVRDAANTIIDALESAVRSGCFERIVILIDPRSKDATGRIITAYARRYPAIKIVPYKWSEPADFAAARNESIRHADTEYCFWLDDDEKIVDPGALRTLLNRPQGKAYLLWVMSPLAGGGSHDMFQPRLFPNVAGARFECAVFERIDWSLRNLGVEIVPTEYRPIQHTGYTNSEVLRRKNARNLRIAERWLRRYPIMDEKYEHLYNQYLKLKGIGRSA